MLNDISWSSYLIFMLIALFVYYVSICLKYYKAEIRDILSGRYNAFQKRTSNSYGFTKSNNQTRLNNAQLHEDDLFSSVNQLTEEIKYSLQQAAENNLIKQEVIYSLQQLAKKYFQIKASPFQSFINNYILIESSNYSSIHLSEEDLNALWVM